MHDVERPISREFPPQKSRILQNLLLADRPIKTIITGIRPGEKIHEILVSEEEANRTIERGNYYVILPILPELCTPDEDNDTLGHEYSSNDNVMTPKGTHRNTGKI